MRIRITFDSADTAEVRDLAAALHAVGHTAEMTVGLNGPERWSGATPHLTPNEFAGVVARIVRDGDRTLADICDEVAGRRGRAGGAL